MATKFKDTSELSFVQPHIEERVQNLSDRISIGDKVKKLDVILVSGDEYENNRIVPYLLLPALYLLGIWGFIKISLWTIINFIAHKKKIEGKTYWKFFDLDGAVRTFWSIPNKREGEVLRPKTVSIFFDHFSEHWRTLRENAASWKALDLIYHYKYGEKPGIWNRLTDLWMMIRNPQAVRNRKKILEKKIEELLIERAKQNPDRPLRTLSVACGSAEAILSAVSKVIKNHNIQVEVNLLDLDGEALNYAKKLAAQFGVEKLNLINDKVSNLEKYTEEKFDLIEMAGFLDYLKYKKAVKIIGQLRNYLKEGGTFITCNINPNSEMFFGRWAVSWPMIYRTPHELAEVLIAAGFDENQITLLQEPQQMHTIALCEKIYNRSP